MRILMMNKTIFHYLCLELGFGSSFLYYICYELCDIRNCFGQFLSVFFFFLALRNSADVFYPHMYLIGMDIVRFLFCTWILINIFIRKVYVCRSDGPNIICSTRVRYQIEYGFQFSMGDALTEALRYTSSSAWSWCEFWYRFDVSSNEVH